MFRGRWSAPTATSRWCSRPSIPNPASLLNAAALHHEHAILASLDLPGRRARPLALEQLGDAPALVLADAGPHNLREWLRRKPMERGGFFGLAVRLVEIVADLHRRNLIHRDLNPFNIVVDGEGSQVTLVDFDAATRVSGVAQKGVPGELEGTAALHRARADRAHGRRRRPPGRHLLAGRHLLRDAERRRLPFPPATRARSCTPTWPGPRCPCPA